MKNSINKAMQTNKHIEKYHVPETRLPFVNTEISETTFQGEKCLVSSIWGGSSGGRLYFWNPDTGTHAWRLLPRGIPGAYMLKEGPDGKLYVGCGNGDLICYNSATDDFKTLVTGELRSITWSGCVTDRYVVWTAVPGDTAVYDWRDEKLVKVFRPLDTETPTALYGHSMIQTPDNKVIVGMNTPQPRLIILDLETMMPLSYTPELDPKHFIHDLVFITETLFGCSHGNELLLFNYPEIKIQHRVYAPEGTGRLYGGFCAQRREYYAVASPSNTLLRLDQEKKRFEVIAENWIGDVIGTSGIWREKNFCAVTVSGKTFHYAADSRRTDSLDLEAKGVLATHAFCVAPEVNMILGASFINQRFWSIDIKTGKHGDRGQAAPGRGQINQIVWDPITERFILSSYTSCSLTAFDPSREAAWPDNPSLLATAKDHGQMRPMALVHDGSHIWMATSPKYGTLGGSLCRVNPRTGEIDVWRHIVPDQKINSLVPDRERKRIYCSSDIYADCNSAPPIAKTAQMVSFCAETLSVLRSDSIRERAPSVKALALLKNGCVLVQEGSNLRSWDPDTGSIKEIEPAPGSITSALSWRPDYGMFFSADGAISRVTIEGETIRFEEVIRENGHMLQIADDKLWYAYDNHICSIKLREYKNSE